MAASDFSQAAVEVDCVGADVVVVLSDAVAVVDD